MLHSLRCIVISGQSSPRPRRILTSEDLLGIRRPPFASARITSRSREYIYIYIYGRSRRGRFEPIQPFSSILHRWYFSNRHRWDGRTEIRGKRREIFIAKRNGTFEARVSFCMDASLHRDARASWDSRASVTPTCIPRINGRPVFSLWPWRGTKYAFFVLLHLPRVTLYLFRSASISAKPLYQESFIANSEGKMTRGIGK